jgi:hypothetical protein
LPTIVLMPDGDIIKILSPISTFNKKLNSLPIDICFEFKFLFPSNELFSTKSSFLKLFCL